MMTRREIIITLFYVLGLCAVYGGAVAFTFGHIGDPGEEAYYPEYNGTTTDWGKSHVDSNYAQCVNQISANDNDWWALPFEAGGAYVDTVPASSNGDSLGWDLSHVGDSASWQHVNEATPNDVDFWYFIPATAGFSVFGYQTAGTSNQSIGATQTATTYTMPGTVILDSITASLEVGASADVPFRAALYLRSSSALVACADSQVVPMGSGNLWVSFPMGTPVTAVQYLVGVLSRNTAGTEVWNYNASVGTTEADTFSLDIIPSFQPCDDPFGVALAQGARRASVYMTYHVYGTANFADFDIDTTQDIDSVVTLVRGEHTGSSSVDVEVVGDTNGTIFVIDTVALTSTMTTFRCPPLTTLNNRQWDLLQLGVRHIEDPDLGDTLQITWLVPVVYGTTPTSDSTAVCIVDFDVDTGNGWHNSDSVKVTVRGTHTGSGTRRVEIVIDSVGDGSGLRAVDTTTVSGSRSFTTDVTRAFAQGWTDRMLDTLQIGTRGLDAATDGDSIVISWLKFQWYRHDSSFDVTHRFFHDSTDLVVGQVSSYEPYDDIWDSSKVTIGRDLPGRNRAFVVVTNPDSLTPKPLSGSQRIEIDSAFLWIMVDTVVGAPELLSIRLINSMRDSSTAIFPSTGEDVAYCHSDWDSRMASAESATQSCGDTVQWAKLGADSAGADYIPALFAVDTVRVDSTGGGAALIRFDVTKWVKMIHEERTGVRDRYNAIQLLCRLAEDSTGGHYAKIGNVRPFKDVDSLWIETFSTEFSTSLVDPGGVITWNDTAYAALGILSNPTISSDGDWGTGNVWTGKLSGDFKFVGCLTLRYGTWLDSTGVREKRLPAPADSVVDSAFLYLVPNMTTGTASTDTIRFHMVTQRPSGLNENATWGWPSKTGASARDDFHRTTGANRMAVGDADSTSGNSANRPWLGSFYTFDTVGGTTSTMDVWPDPIGLVATTTPHSTTLKIDVTEWFDSLQFGQGASIEERIRRYNGLLIYNQRIEKPTNNLYEAWKNFPPRSSGGSTIQIFLSEAVVVTPPESTPRNRLRNGKGMKPNKRDFDRGSFSVLSPDFTPDDSLRIVVVGAQEAP